MKKASVSRVTKVGVVCQRAPNKWQSKADGPFFDIVTKLDGFKSEEKIKEEFFRSSGIKGSSTKLAEMTVKRLLSEGYDLMYCGKCSNPSDWNECQSISTINQFELISKISGDDNGHAEL
jgi:hypothetical protein